jgi:hypothetical protein
MPNCLSRNYQEIEQTVEILRGRITEVSWIVGSSRSARRIRRETLSTHKIMREISR